MNFSQHIRLAGAVVCIVSCIVGNMTLNLIGLGLMAFGAVLHLDNLEKRVKTLESKEPKDD